MSLAMSTTRVAPDQPQAPAPRTRLYRRPRGYGLVLLAIVLAIIVIAASSDGPVDRFLGLVVLAAALLLALRAAQVPRRMFRSAIVLIVLALAGGLAALLTGRGTPAFTGALTLIVVGLTPIVLATRLVRNPEVTAESLIGAVCVYLLIGIFFNIVFELAAEVTGTPFFVQTDQASSADYLYFAYITLSTVGYGDLAPRTTLDRMLAATDALTGQAYLVTVVALLVSNFRRRPD
jgi:Ion channel